MTKDYKILKPLETALGHPPFPSFVEGGPSFQISASQIQAFLACPRFWAWQYVLKQKQPSKAAFKIGTATHAELEAYELEGTAPDVDRVLSVEGKVYYPGIIARSMLSGRVLECRDKNPKVEKYIKYEKDGIRIIGYIDLYWVDGKTAYVVDHKTSSNPKKWGKSLEDIAEDIQTCVYCAAVAQAHPEVEDIYFGFNYGSTCGSPQKAYYIEEGPFSAKQAAEAIDEYLIPLGQLMRATAKDKNIKNHVINPASCSNYGGCYFIPRCDLSFGERTKTMDTAALIEQARARAAQGINPTTQAQVPAATVAPAPQVPQAQAPQVPQAQAPQVPQAQAPQVPQAQAPAVPGTVATPAPADHALVAINSAADKAAFELALTELKGIAVAGAQNAEAVERVKKLATALACMVA